jgi:hypothetical protein
MEVITTLDYGSSATNNKKDASRKKKDAATISIMDGTFIRRTFFFGCFYIARPIFFVYTDSLHVGTLFVFGHNCFARQAIIWRKLSAMMSSLC